MKIFVQVSEERQGYEASILELVKSMEIKDTYQGQDLWLEVVRRLTNYFGSEASVIEIAGSTPLEVWKASNENLTYEQADTLVERARKEFR